MAKKKDSYSDYLKQQFGELIDRLDITDLQKTFLKSRWLDQLMWLEKKAGESQKKHFRLRLVTIVGGVIIPAMVSLNVNDGRAKEAIFWGTFGLAQVVAISAAIEEFFHYGEKWTQYRKTAEMLKTEGWQYFQLSGPYKKSKSHGGNAYRSFADRVEKLIQEDVSAVTAVMQEDKEDKEQKIEEAYEFARNIGATREIPPPPPPAPPTSYPAPAARYGADPTRPRYDTAPGNDALSDDVGGELTPAPAPLTSQPPRSGKPRVTAPPPPDIDDPKLANLDAPPGEPVKPRST